MVADFASIATHGWFPGDGQVPDICQVATHGWWDCRENVKHHTDWLQFYEQRKRQGRRR